MSPYEQSEVAGGIRVVSESIPGVRSVALGVFANTGSRDERETEGGVSHFLEHLFFKGTDRWSALEIAETFDALGAEANAYTSKETTVLHARFLDLHLNRAFEMMADMMLRPAFREMDTEREVILEEIAMYEDEPQDKVSDILLRALYGDHPLGRPVIGTGQTLKRLGRPEVAEYHRDRYVASNLVVAGAGALDHAALVDLVERHMDGVASGGESERGRSDGVEPDARTLFERKDTDQYNICLGNRGIARADDRRFALAILDAIFGGSVSSRLFQEIREKRGLAYAISSFVGHFEDTGYTGVYLGAREDSIQPALEIVASESERLRTDPASPAELDRAKENYKGRFVLSMESTMTRMGRLGGSVSAGVELLTMDEVISRIDGVGVDDLAELAHECYDPNTFAAAGIGPQQDRFENAIASVADAGAVETS